MEHGKDKKRSGQDPDLDKKIHQLNETDRNDGGGTRKPAAKKKSQAGLWILISVSFLVLVGGISVYLGSRNNPDADVQMRSVTLTDVGFDTPVTFQAETSEEDFNRYLSIVRETFTENNQLFDQYNSYEGVNNVYTLNQEAADHPVEVDSKIIDLIEEARKASEINPKFDIAEGKLLSLWHDVREEENPVLPSKEAIQSAMEHTDLDGVAVKGNSISYSDDSIQLDLGAIAKGYTAEEARQKLMDAGLDNGFINAGGNVVLIGEKPDGRDWVVGIQNPDESGSLLRLSFDAPVSMVTSGDYQRYVTIDGKRYSHIIDPETGYPAAFMRSVTVVADDSGWADAMSTALFAMPVEEGKKKARELGIEAVWITDEGSIDLKPDASAGGFDIYLTDGLRRQLNSGQDTGS